MTEAVEPLRPAGRKAGPLAPILFAVAIFTSACLVFVVQPMAAKLILPTLGGSPSVWNASMVFFQTALLAGYAYAHLLQRLPSLRAQVGAHLALLALAALFLPLRISGVFGDPDAAQPALWLLATLAVSIGAPFAVLSATAPLLQAWYARVRAGHADGKNPYVLYAASNLGSFLALLAYPILIEPLASLSGQRLGWSLGYGLFAAMVIGLGLLVWRRREVGAAEPAPLAVSAPIPWREKGMLVLLAAAPSSLMLGVTAHLATDVASAPFLWVIPLALYLLTFVIAFQTRPAVSPVLALSLQGAMAAACAALIAFRTGEWVLVFTVNLAAFFFTALMCHQRLAARRPPPDRLTEILSAAVAGRGGRRGLQRSDRTDGVQHGLGISAGPGGRGPAETLEPARDTAVGDHVRRRRRRDRLPGAAVDGGGALRARHPRGGARRAVDPHSSSHPGHRGHVRLPRAGPGCDVRRGAGGHRLVGGITWREAMTGPCRSAASLASCVWPRSTIR